MTEFMIHSFLAILFFYTINWFGKHITSSGYMSLSLFYKADEAPIFNNLFRIIAPSVLLMITGATLTLLGFTNLIKNIWLTIPIMIGYRTFYNLLFERRTLINWKTYGANTFFTIGLSYWLHKSIISKNQYFFPDLQSFGNEFWLLVILFIYQTFNSISFSSEGSILRKDNYINNRYRLLKNKFGEIIHKKATRPELEILTYSIAIIEMFNRPAAFRFAERIKSRILPSHTSTGIMQVKNDVPLSDLESLNRGIEILNDEFDKVEKASRGKRPEYFSDEGTDRYQERLLRRVTWLYNNSDDYVGEVMTIYDILKKRFYSIPKKVEKDIYNAFSNYS